LIPQIISKKKIHNKQQGKQISIINKYFE